LKYKAIDNQIFNTTLYLLQFPRIGLNSHSIRKSLHSKLIEAFLQDKFDRISLNATPLQKWRGFTFN